MPPLPFKISLKDTSFHISINSLGLHLSPEFLLNFLWKFYVPPPVRKISKFMEFTFLENALIRGIFTHVPPHSKISPPSTCHHALGRTKLLITPNRILLKIYFPQQQKGVAETMICFIKLSLKIWRWLGTLGFSYFVWYAIFTNVMTL